MDEIISLKNIDYSYYGKIPALTNITLSINKGEMFSVIGLNGSGKSTLLHIINALVYPDAGSVEFDGNPVNEKSMSDKSFGLQFRQRMGYIFQNPDIQLFCPTVFDELLFGPLQVNLPLEIARERAEQTLSYLGIEYLRERPVYMLSGGEKKRVAIASILTMNPDVLLVDEPLSSLDPKTQTFFMELLLELNKAGKTIIFTTHQLDLIEHLQPRVVVLSDDHTIRKTGTASEILNDEELLISVNLIHEHVHKHGNEEHRHYHSHYVFHKHWLRKSTVRIDVISNLNNDDALFDTLFNVHSQPSVLEKLKQNHFRLCDDLVVLYLTNPELFGINPLIEKLNVRYNKDYDLQGIKEAISDISEIR